MREILFRAKRIDNGEWIEGGFYREESYDLKAESTYIIVGTQDCVGCAYKVIPETVGQYIGLTDKNGKKIFEGDIVGRYNVYRKRYFVGIVEYGEFNCSCCNGVYGWHFNNEDIREHDTYEVLGNIFDNPELLGGDGE